LWEAAELDLATLADEVLDFDGGRDGGGGGPPTNVFGIGICSGQRFGGLGVGCSLGVGDGLDIEGGTGIDGSLGLGRGAGISVGWGCPVFNGIDVVEPTGDEHAAYIQYVPNTGIGETAEPLTRYSPTRRDSGLRW